jgi:hypothetical protein
VSNTRAKYPNLAASELILTNLLHSQPAARTSGIVAMENNMGGIRKSAGTKTATKHNAVIIRNLSIGLFYIISTVICHQTFPPTKKTMVRIMVFYNNI